VVFVSVSPNAKEVEGMLWLSCTISLATPLTLTVIESQDLTGEPVANPNVEYRWPAWLNMPRLLIRCHSSSRPYESEIEMNSRKPHILGIPGSLRHGSYSGAVLRGLQDIASARAHIEVFTLDTIPLYNADLDGDDKPAPVVALKKSLHDCDGLVLSSPEYNYGISGVLKNALDWASRPGYQSVLKDKPVLIMTSSPGIVGGVRAQGQLRQTLAATLSRVIAVPEVIISQVNKKVQDGRLVDPPSLKFMLEALEVLLAEILKG
jgi:chromate reductase